jgi:signal transduction histidine kinase
MSKLRTLLKKHLVLAGLAAVVAPLLTILGLQYWSLKQLRKSSVLAGTVVMKNYLNDASKEVRGFYRTAAEGVLNIPVSSMRDGDLLRAGQHFERCTGEGVKRLFVARFEPGGEVQIRFFDSPGARPVTEVPQAETHAAQRVAVPMQHLSAAGTIVRRLDGPEFHDYDPDNLVLFKPIVDETSRVVGVAGMILDTPYFRDVLMPRVVSETLPRFFPDGAHRNVIVALHDSARNRLFASQEAEGQKDVIALRLPYFSDYSLVIRSRHMTSEQWASWNFKFTLTLSLLMTGVLVAGIAFSLRTAAREMRLSQMKADFVSNVSHELRTPLASIRVFGEFMKLGRVSEPGKIQEYGEHIETESRRLTQLINNILDFSKIESGAKTYNFERLAVEDVVAETLRTCEVRLRQVGFDLVYHPSPRPLPRAMVDADALAQALMNLLDNAVKYSAEAAQREVVVRAGERAGRIEITVTDHGVGIAPAEQRKIFEKFYRVSTGLVHDVKGSGLGLSLVKHIVEAHGGSVTVTSDLGRGSTFTISLPAAERAAGTADTKGPRPIIGEGPSQGLAYKPQP